MLVHFHIHYYPNQKEILKLYGSAPETGDFQEDKALEMSYLGDGYWHLPLEIEGAIQLEYRYLVREAGHITRREWGNNHHVFLPPDVDLCTLYDYWQPESDMRFLYTAAYTDCLMAVQRKGSGTNYLADHVILKVEAPFVKKGQSIGISGNIDLLGLWKEEKALRMKPDRFPTWSISMNAGDLPESCCYKLVVIDDITGKIISWEWGEPRSLFTPRCMDRQMLMHSGIVFRFQEAPWKGAGTTIPVFSLRSVDSWGCGDFADLKKMTDWAELTGQQMIQLLPVNDTSLLESGCGSNPYNAVSAFALHPIYASIKDLPELRDETKKLQYETKRQRLNALPSMNYEEVFRLKQTYLQDLFNQEGHLVLETADYRIFFEKNHDWLVPYAAFCYLRKSRNSYDFRDWGEYAIYDARKVEDLCRPDQAFYKEIAIYFYIQYRLHQQLRAARNYAHNHSVVLNGDIAFGVSRFSADVWTDPRLFNPDVQIGTPPEASSVNGQEWGFPGYNWDNGKVEIQNWWTRRLRKTSDYFDACRMDHLYDFFRVWEIPSHSKDGLLGRYSPALPFSAEELSQQGFSFDEKSMTEPYITEKLVENVFGESADNVRKAYLQKMSNGRYELNSGFDTQQKTGEGLFETKEDKKVLDGLRTLCSEVLFVKDQKVPGYYHPRIAGSDTACYESLSPEQKESFDRLYRYFYRVRNIDFWKSKAYEILPALVDSTRMLICSGDPGKLLPFVPEVMHNLGILSLEIQRMAGNPDSRTENLNAIPYQSVCTTSTYNTSPIRSWWQEDKRNTQQYYQQVLWKKGEAPEECIPEIAEQIIRLHLESPALWVILPWQDWMSFDGKLRNPEAEAERIYDPSKSNRDWNYRMHITLDDLLKEKDFNRKIRSLIKGSGR